MEIEGLRNLAVRTKIPETDCQAKINEGRKFRLQCGGAVVCLRCDAIFVERGFGLMPTKPLAPSWPCNHCRPGSWPARRCDPFSRNP